MWTDLQPCPPYCGAGCSSYAWRSTPGSAIGDELTPLIVAMLSSLQVAVP